MSNLLKKRLGILIIVAGIINSIIGFFLYTVLLPTDLMGANRTITVFIIFGCVAGVIGAFMYWDWNHNPVSNH